MSTIRRRRPKYEFTQIPNAALRDYRLSWRARGLLAELLSYPPGYEISVDELVKRARRAAGATEGRDAMRTAVRELKQVGYIVSTRRQDARGRWITETEVTDDPAYELPGSPLPDGETTPVSPPAPTSVSAGRTDDGFSGVGEPGVGEPGSNKNTEINTEINTVLPPTPSTGGVPASTPTGKKEEEEKKKKQQQGITALRGEARQLVEAALRLWHSDHQRPSAPTMRKLVDRVTAELAAGATPDAIIAVLTHNLHPSQARSAVRVVMARTKEAGWAVETTNPTELMQNTRPAWCGVCDETTRQRIRVLPDGRDEVVRCPECHPMAANPAPTPPPAAEEEEETIYFVYHAGGDEPTGGTGEVWDLPAPPAAEQDRDTATDTVPHTIGDHSAPPPAIIADLRAKLAEIRRQKAS